MGRIGTWDARVWSEGHVHRDRHKTKPITGLLLLERGCLTQ